MSTKSTIITYLINHLNLIGGNTHSIAGCPFSPYTYKNNIFNNATDDFKYLENINDFPTISVFQNSSENRIVQGTGEVYASASFMVRCYFMSDDSDEQADDLIEDLQYNLNSFKYTLKDQTPILSTYWDTNFVTPNVNVSFTSNNLTVESGNVVGVPTGGFANTPIQNGQKRYFEVVNVVPSPVNIDGTGIGIANVTAYQVTSGISGEYAGNDANSAVIYDQAGDFYFNGDTGLFANSFGSANDVLGVAVDRLNNKLWFRTNQGYWNKSSTADPANNIGGFDISGIRGNVYPVFDMYTGANARGKISARFGVGSSIQYAPPVGFTLLDTWKPVEAIDLRIEGVSSDEKTLKPYGVVEVAIVLSYKLTI
jgi:hypothetical protein